MYDFSERPTPIDLGDGFIVRSATKPYLEKHDLLGKGSLHFVNALSTLVEEHQDDLPEEEWAALERTLKRLMIDYERGELYNYLIQTYGADAINYSAWVHFSMDTVWSVCVKTFTDMPTAILEEYGVRHWDERDKTVGEEGSRNIMDALSARDDIYGRNGGLPAQMVKGILFNHAVQDIY